MFRFEYPLYLYVCAALPIIALGLYWAFKRQESLLSRFGHLPIVTSLIDGYDVGKTKRNYVLIFTGLAFLIFSGSNPQWGTKRESVKSVSSDIFILLDISTSMLAQDVAPSRMERAKRFTQSLVEGLKGNRIGLIPFAQSAFIQSPLTNDYAAVNLMVKSASPSLAGTQGTNITNALEIADEAFLKEDANQRAVVVITDGEDHEGDLMSTAQSLRESGTFIYSVGVGSENGGPIPIPYNNTIVYKKDNEGNPVQSKLNVDLINQIAQAGGGSAHLVNEGQSAIQKIIEGIDKLEKREVQQESFSEYNSYYQYFLLMGLILLSLGVFLPAKNSVK